MEELKNLSLMAQEAINRFSDYDGHDFELPQIFKDNVKEINSNSIIYNKFSAIIETKGYQNGTLNIYMPNQWFYVASYFTNFFNELIKYKKYALKVATKDRLKILNGSDLTEEENKNVQDLDLSTNSKEYLVKFITDYSWWGGAKTIDRGDFFVSPVLSHAKLVNASQSFVADLCAFLSDKQELVNVILNNEDICTSRLTSSNLNTSLQQIFYGAPGTGKSHTVDDACKKFSHHRVTFHPDSDYSTFVGCYKPTKENTIGVLSQSELINKLTEIKDTGTTYPCHKFSVKYWESLIKLSTPQIKELLLACGFTDSMTTEVSKGVSIGQHFNDIASNKSITYAFTPQAFTNAYIEAWQKQAAGESVFLVIEEINRGNCAQIFGDLFQLLDRDGKGFSKYEIVPDKDLQDYIATNGKLDVSGIKDSDGNDISCEINNGSLLKLPDNLYIWATMNTSDQSLFPIDSAFKRRWDWKYVPIKNHADRNFKIKFDYEVENKDEDGNITFSTESYEQDWWKFIDAVNVRIESATHSEDKQLGYFFCNPDDGIIDGSMFVSKVIFFLWNDVFKNTGSKSVFNVNNKKVPFTAFYLIDDEEIERQKEFNPDGLNLELVKDFIEEIIKNKAQ